MDFFAYCLLFHGLILDSQCWALSTHFFRFPVGLTYCLRFFLLKSGALFFRKKKDANDHIPVEFSVVFRKDTGRGNLVTEIRHAASYERRFCTCMYVPRLVQCY